MMNPVFLNNYFSLVQEVISMHDKLYELIETVEQMKTTNDWIPISEREPDGADHVLVTLYWKDDDWTEVSELDYGVLKASGNNLIKHVVAWKPMPEPYDHKSERKD